MKATHWKAVTVVTMLLASSWLVSVTVSESVYDPWCDLDEDGDIDIFDIVRMAGMYGTTGDPFAATAALEYDSGWVNITDKRGQYFNITHNMDSTDIIIDIAGKRSSDSEPNKIFYGLTTHVITDPGWNNTYGGEVCRSVVQTTDGGYAIAGTGGSYNGSYAYLVKTDAAGNHLWNQTYGGTSSDVVYSGGSMVQTLDGGYVIAGIVGFWNGVYYSHDVLLMKTDAAGNHLWNHTYGGEDPWCEDYGYSVVQTTDGGYAIAGWAESFGIGGWLMKTDAAGNHLWNQTYGGDEGTSFGIARSMVQTTDGGYAIAGTASTYEGNDIYLVKTDADGAMQWNKTYGAYYLDSAESLVQTSDGGYAIAGTSYSDDVKDDFWLVKTDAAGNHLWNRTYGGPNYDSGYSMVQTTDGGYAIAGITWSFGAGDGDVWLVKTDASGNHVWNHTYGGTYGDYGYSVVQTTDGGYVIAGVTGSFGAGYSDVWLVKTFGPGEAPMIEVWLAWTASSENTVTLYRGEDDPYWNYMRVRIWIIKDTS